MDQSAYLFVDNLPIDDLRVLSDQLKTVNRIGQSSKALIYTWQINVLEAQADHQNCKDDQTCRHFFVSIIRNRLKDLSESIRGHHITLTVPLTIIELLEILKMAEQQLLGSHKVSESLHNELETEQNTSPVLVETVSIDSSNEVVADTENTVEHSAIVGFFTQYLSDAGNMQPIIFNWLNEKIWVNAAMDKIYSNCHALSDLMTLLSRVDAPDIEAWSEPSDEVATFSFSAVCWSYGLHAPLGQDFLAEYDVSNQRFRLKKWPLFGRWETAPELLLLTTLFTQKFITIDEAVVKSSLSRTCVLHFLAAVRYAQLPMESEACEVVDVVHVSAKKNVAWIDHLRQKLQIQDALSK